MTSNARMLWAFSRDGAVPGSSIWHKVDPKTKIPRNAVWGMVFFAMLLGCVYTSCGVCLGVSLVLQHSDAYIEDRAVMLQTC